jgi:hypothetical protein
MKNIKGFILLFLVQERVIRLLQYGFVFETFV